MTQIFPSQNNATWANVHIAWFQITKCLSKLLDTINAKVNFLSANTNFSDLNVQGLLAYMGDRVFVFIDMCMPRYRDAL
jgi:hypothetical protein